MSGFGTGICGICGKPCRWDDDFCSDLCQAEADRRSEETSIPEGGYCFDCRVGFENEQRADAHYAMTGHQIGWPFEDVDWPLATDEQVYARGSA